MGFTEFTNKSEQMGLQPAKKGILQHHKPDRILKLTSVDILATDMLNNHWDQNINSADGENTPLSDGHLSRFVRLLPMLPIEMAVWLDVSH